MYPHLKTNKRKYHLRMLRLSFHLKVDSGDDESGESIDKDEELRVGEFFAALVVFVSTVFSCDNSLLKHTPGQIGRLRKLLTEK